MEYIGICLSILDEPTVYITFCKVNCVIIGSENGLSLSEPTLTIGKLRTKLLSVKDVALMTFSFR